MPKVPYKSTAKLWKQAPGPAQKYRDRKRITLPDGSRKEVFGYGRTKREATDSLYRTIERLTREHPSGQTITVTQAFARLLRHKRSVKGRRRKTLHNDAKLYRLHVQPHIGSKLLIDVDLADLEDIQHRLVAAKHYRTAELATILLKSIWRFAMRTYRQDIRAGKLHLYDLTEDLEQITRPDNAKPKQQTLWTSQQLQAFLDESRREYAASLKHLFYPVFHTFIAAGLRRGEALALTRDSLQSRQIEIDGRRRRQFYLEVREQLAFTGGRGFRGPPKSTSGVREVPIGLLLARDLRRHMHKVDRLAKRNPDWQKTDLLFPSFNGKHIEPRNLYRARDRLITRLKLPDSTLHQMRRVYGTYVTRDLIRRGKYSPKIVQALLGHSDPSVALEFYTQVIEEDYRTATFDPIRGENVATAGIPAGKTAKEKDAKPVDSAS